MQLSAGPPDATYTHALKCAYTIYIVPEGTKAHPGYAGAFLLYASRRRAFAVTGIAAIALFFAQHLPSPKKGQ